MRYFIAFVLTSAVYVIGTFTYFYYMVDIQRPVKLNEEKRIALNHISLIQQQEIKEEKAVVKKSQKPLKKPKKVQKEVITRSQKVKPRVQQPKKETAKKVVVKEEIKPKKEPQQAQPKLIKTAIKRDYKQAFINEHLKQIVTLIQQNIKYPKRARKLNIQGEVLIEFMITKEGGIKEFKTIKGHRLLQKATMKAIESASKSFPKVKKDLKLVVPVVYELT